MIRGPFALGNNSVVKMGAKIYGASTVGPHSKVGGEIKNSVIFGSPEKFQISSIIIPDICILP